MAEETRSDQGLPSLSGADIRTFLFADMRGYTRFTQERGDDAASAIADRFADVVREAVPAFEGELLELRGDEALCVFRSARQALRASVELQRRLRTATDGESAFPLGVGMGLDAGEAVPTQGGYRGASLNLAARLCALAKPGEILATESVAHLAQRVEGLRLVAGRSARLKGLAQPVRFVVVVSETILPPVPDSVAAVRRRFGPRRLTALIGGAAIVVAVALLAGTLSGHSTGPALAANAVGSLTPAGSVSSQVVLPRGGRPGGITAGVGRVWATDTVNRSLLEIDPSSGTIIDTVPNVGAVPAGVAVGGGGVWVADSAGATVSWFNASAPSAATPIRVGQGPGPIAYGLGAAWVVNTIDGTLQRISSGRKASAPTSIGVSPIAVAVGAGSVWVADSASNSVVRVSGGGQVTDRINVGNDPVALAFGGGDLWVANAADGTVTRIDPDSDGQRVVPVGGQPTGATFASASLWVSIAQPDRIARINPATRRVIETTLASPPRAITSLGDHVWITSLASPASHRGGTLRILFGATNDGSSLFAAGEPPFDPGAAGQPAQFSLLHLTNDGLVALRQASGPAGGQVVPDLAVGPPAISDGGKTYTFRLRRGIHYSTGELVRPSDFRFAIERQFLHLNPPISYGYQFLTDIRGESVCENSPPRCHTALAAGIVPNDAAGTLTIHLVHADVGFIYDLATTWADLLPPDTPKIDSGQPVPATGPYMISHTSARGVTLVRNPRFHEWSADAQPTGFPNVIQWTFQPNPSRALTQVEHSDADVMLDQPPASRANELRTTYATLAHPYAQLTTTFIAFNTSVEPFSNLLSRRAVNLAIDRRRIAVLQGGPVVSVPTCQVLPPGMFGYRPYCPYTTHPNPASGAWRAPDLARARALVHASATRGAQVDLRACGCIGVRQPVARYVADVLTRLGYQTHLLWTNDPSTYYANATIDPRARAPLVVIEGWVSDYPYPTDFFVTLLSCGSGRVGPEPGIKYCNHHLDHLVRRAANTQGISAVRAWFAADREAVNQAAWAPLTNGTGVDVIATHVGDYQRNPQYGILLDQLWVK